MSMDFIGKWSFSAQGGNYVKIDPATGALAVGPKPLDGSQNFNAYGATDKLMLQAANGKYLAASGAGYQANLDRDGAVSYFAIEDAGGGALRIADLGVKGAGTERYCWNNQNGALQRVPDSGTPPPTTLFNQTVVTVGLAQFKQSGFPAPQPDLSWAYLSGADMTGVAFSEANLAHADLSNANIAGAPMQTAILSGANLSGANITDMADFTNAMLDNADLTGARLTDVVMNGTKLPGAILNGAKLQSASLNNAVLTKAKLRGADMTGAQIVIADFTGADLTGAIFTRAIVRTITIIDADLTGVQMSNPNLTNPTIDLSDAKLSAKTNLTHAKMQYVDLQNHDLQHVVMAHADLTGSRLDHTKLSNAELPYANLTNVTLTGGVPMYATNLSNATLTGANLTGAQMGSISLLFRVTDQNTFDTFQKALNADDVPTVKTIFGNNGVTLQGSVIISPSQYAANRAWEVRTDQKTYTVRLEAIGTSQALGVYETVTAAILSNAFMKGAILTSANLYNVRASGVQLYGNARLDGNAILERAQFDNANMGSINLKQAKLYGVNLDYATLTDAQFQGADLSLDAGGGQASLARANLQGADFSNAVLDNAVFTDAAVSVARSDGSQNADGVWLFSAAPAEATACIPELQAGVKQFTLAIDLEAALKQGPVTAPLRAAFQQHGITLAQEALVTIEGQGPGWQIDDGATTYQIVPACDQDQYQPALGVQRGAAPQVLFTIPLYLEKVLKNGPVAPAVSDAFKQHGVTLGAAAHVTAAQRATDWQVVDTSGSYTLWEGLDESCQLSIFARPSMPNLLELFSNHSTPLSRRTTVPSAETGRWGIDNDSNDPYNPVTNYIKFNLVLDTSDGSLDIYGSALRVRRLAAAGQVEYHNINCNVTVLTQKELPATTVCPNSLRVEVNQSDQIPFKKWMQARELPKPPFCVPSADGYFYCPPSGPSDSSEPA